MVDCEVEHQHCRGYCLPSQASTVSMARMVSTSSASFERKFSPRYTQPSIVCRSSACIRRRSCATTSSAVSDTWIPDSLFVSIVSFIFCFKQISVNGPTAGAGILCLHLKRMCWSPPQIPGNPAAPAAPMFLPSRADNTQSAMPDNVLASSASVR